MLPGAAESVVPIHERLVSALEYPHRAEEKWVMHGHEIRCALPVNGIAGGTGEGVPSRALS
jgi:hypothetical protein